MSITLSNLKTQFFSNIDLNLKENEKVAIVGENGIGKTSLLRTLLGFVDFEGDIKILDKKLKSKKDFKEIYCQIGYLFQDSDDSFIASSVVEEISFNLYNQIQDYEYSKGEALKLLEQFNVLHLENKIPVKLSGGQKRIVALCACLIHNPKLLLLDEPTNHLDDKVKVIVEEKLKNYEGSMIFIAHDIDFAKKISDKIYRLTNKGLTSYN